MWSAHITSLLSREAPRTSDISLLADSHSFALHKFLLSARSPYFRQKLAGAPGTETWRLPSSLPIESFRIVMQYLYLDEIPRDIVGPGSENTEEEVLKGIDRISKDLEVEKLWESMLAMNDRRLTRQRYQDEVNRAQEQLRSFFETDILGNKMVVEQGELDEVKWPRTNSIFADCLLAAYEPAPSTPEDAPGGTALPPEAKSTPAGVPAPSRKAVVFPAHRAMLIRSPYFETMFSSVFKEAQESEYLHVITVDCAPDVLRLVLSFLYTETANCPLDLALDVLYAADMLFLDKLKGKAVTAISTLGSATANALVDRTHGQEGGEGDEGGVEVEPINIYDVIHAAWDLGVQRLEEFAARYLAYRLEDYIDEEEFAELIRLSAGRIEEREETDTIELLDDIRYYLSERFRLRFEDAGLVDVMEERPEVDALAGDMEKVGLREGEEVGGEEVGGEEVRGEEAVAAKTEKVENEPATESLGEGEEKGQNGVIRTLDGKVAADEFDSDAINYEILMGKIDDMLERLKLDA